MCEIRKVYREMLQKHKRKIKRVLTGGVTYLMMAGQGFAAESTAYIVPENMRMEIRFCGENTAIRPEYGWSMWLNDRVLLADHVGEKIRQGHFYIQETVSNKNFVNYRSNKEVQWKYLNTAKFSEDNTISIAPVPAKRTDLGNTIQYKDEVLIARNGYVLRSDLIPREYHMSASFIDPQGVHHEMMDQSVRFRYRNSRYRVWFDYHYPDESNYEGDKVGSFVENLTYLSLPRLELTDTGKDENARFHTLGWKIRASPEDVSQETVTGGENFITYSGLELLGESKHQQKTASGNLKSLLIRAELEAAMEEENTDMLMQETEKHSEYDMEKDRKSDNGMHADMKSEEEKKKKEIATRSEVQNEEQCAILEGNES